jgi:hypothetical protein
MSRNQREPQGEVVVGSQIYSFLGGETPQELLRESHNYVVDENGLGIGRGQEECCSAPV